MFIISSRKVSIVDRDTMWIVNVESKAVSEVKIRRKQKQNTNFPLTNLIRMIIDQQQQ